MDSEQLSCRPADTQTDTQADERRADREADRQVKDKTKHNNNNTQQQQKTTPRQTQRELTTSVNEIDLGQLAVGDGGLEVERGQQVGGVLQRVAPGVEALVLTHPGEHLLQRQLRADAHHRLLSARQVDGEAVGDLQHGTGREVSGRARLKAKDWRGGARQGQTRKDNPTNQHRHSMTGQPDKTGQEQHNRTNQQIRIGTA